MVSLYRISITKEQLAGLCKDRRALLLLSGHTLNVIATWLKIGKLVSNPEDKDEIIRQSNIIQIMTITRAYFGAIIEAYRWISRNDNKMLLEENYINLIVPDARGAYNSIVDKFEKDMKFRRIRNNFSYHYPSSDLMESAFNLVPEDDDWSWYFSDFTSNSFFYSSELVLSYGMIDPSHADTVEKRFELLITDSAEIAALWQRFLIGLLEAMMTFHFPQIFHFDDKITLSGRPNVSNVHAGFLVELR